MDKISHSNSQAMPLWERSKNSRGHRSAVDGALEAHRQRVSERQTRVQERLNMAKDISSQFFPQPQVAPVPDLEVSTQNSLPIAIESQIPAELEMDLSPRQIDDFYNEAQFGMVADNAQAIINKEISNPEEGPVEDVPKGSYIDYSV